MFVVLTSKFWTAVSRIQDYLLEPFYNSIADISFCIYLDLLAILQSAFSLTVFGNVEKIKNSMDMSD
jgi:hypothetical protein